MRIRQHLLDNSLAQSTRKSYGHALTLYHDFHAKTILPISASRLSKFIVFLVAKHYKASSIQSVLSGLSYFHSLCLAKSGQPLCNKKDDVRDQTFNSHGRFQTSHHP
ncbi:MAG: site-specific integrase [Candidatus Thiodiazotropha sp.]|nr:site-specific integrase [Candidatus Thiodiazotropha sp.]